MSCSPAVTFAVICLCAFCATSGADEISIQNRGTNSVRVVSSSGSAVFLSGSSGQWSGVGEVTVSRDGAADSTFTAAAGHDYALLVGESSTAVVDTTPASAQAFMAGLAFSMVWGLTVMSFSWTRALVAGGGVNE